MNPTSIVSTIMRNPRGLGHKFLSFIRGTYYIVVYRVINNKTRIMFPFYAEAPVKISGSGTVVIGKSCRVLLNMYKGLTIVTKNADSKVAIGDNCALGGLTVRCTGNISFGNKLMTAYSLVQDSYSSVTVTTTCNGKYTEDHQIIVGNNVWIGAQSIILGGCKIGDDSVLSFGTLCHNMEVGEFRLITGNPAKRSLPIDNILQLMGAR